MRLLTGPCQGLKHPQRSARTQTLRHGRRFHLDPPPLRPQPPRPAGTRTAAGSRGPQSTRASTPLAPVATRNASSRCRPTVSRRGTRHTATPERLRGGGGGAPHRKSQTCGFGRKEEESLLRLQEARACLTKWWQDNAAKRTSGLALLRHVCVWV